MNWHPKEKMLKFRWRICCGLKRKSIQDDRRPPISGLFQGGWVDLVDLVSRKFGRKCRSPLVRITSHCFAMLRSKVEFVFYYEYNRHHHEYNTFCDIWSVFLFHSVHYGASYVLMFTLLVVCCAARSVPMRSGPQALGRQGGSQRGLLKFPTTSSWSDPPSTHLSHSLAFRVWHHFLQTNLLETSRNISRRQAP